MQKFYQLFNSCNMHSNGICQINKIHLFVCVKGDVGNAIVTP